MIQSLGEIIPSQGVFPEPEKSQNVRQERVTEKAEKLPPRAPI